MTDYVALLREAAGRLQAAYDLRRADLLADMTKDGRAAYLTPEDMVDPSGRSILLDALTALVNARAVLAAVPDRPSTPHTRSTP